MAIAETEKLTPQQYLEIERSSEGKHEYIEGDIIAMTGATRAHNLIVLNLLQMLANFLQDKSVEIYPSDMRVGIPSSGIYTYPDVSVVCEEPAFEDDVFDTLLNPTVIIEVLSESTEAHDRGRKFAHYRMLDSLADYVLVSQSEYRVEIFSRESAETWIFTEAGGEEGTIVLPAVDCPISLKDVYRRVTLTPEPQEKPQ